MAGGFGTRISEESQFKPKPMISIGGKPILWHIMKEYSYYGYDDFIICAGYKQYVIKEWFADYFLHNSDVTFDYSNGKNEMTIHESHMEPWKVTVVDTGLNTMTGGRIKRIQKYIGNEPFMLTYGDGVCDVDINKLVEFHKLNGKLATLTSVMLEQQKGILDDYSWPVIYPKTGNALSYYYNFFLPAALVGKILGWKAANIFLCLFTWAGVCISMLLICKIFKINSLKYSFLIAITFVVWQGMESLRIPLINLLNIGSAIGYQYSPNNTLLQWVTNQTIVPWIAVPLFLDKRNIRTYIYLGMCVLSSAPFPFVGMFVFLAIDGVAQLCKNYKYNIQNWLRDVFSMPNLSACFIILAYLFFYMSNTAATGSTGVGGFGLYVPIDQFSWKQFVFLVSFLFFNFIIYALLVYKENKKDSIYWTTCISLLLIPHFRLGTGNDFGMRVSIPAQFILMIFILKFFLCDDLNAKSIRYLLMTGIMSIAMLNIYNDFISRLTVRTHVETENELFRDDLSTFSNKVYGCCYVGGGLENFICKYPEETFFFSKLCKSKSMSLIQTDCVVANKYLENNNFLLVSGDYKISPITDITSTLFYEGDALSIRNGINYTTISDSTVSGRYEFYFVPDNRIWLFSEEQDEIVLSYGAGSQIWGTSELNNNQLFSIEPIDDAYLIVWDGRYALTYSQKNVYWNMIDYSESQLWKIEQ